MKEHKWIEHYSKIRELYNSGITIKNISHQYNTSEDWNAFVKNKKYIQ